MATLLAAVGCSPKERTYPGSGGAGGSGGSGHGGSGGVETTSTAMCVPESDTEYCVRLGKTCEPVSDADNCGLPRTVDCGACADPQVCLANVCHTPVCAGLTYAGAGVPIPELSVVGLQDAIEGATPTGSSILVHRSKPCGWPATTFLADETAPGSGTYSLLEVLPIAGMNTDSGPLALTSDGLTILGSTINNDGFVASTRSAVGLVDFGPASGIDFAAIVLTGNQLLTTPVISADGLAFYYLVSGELPGLYESVRASTSVPFPPGTLLPDPAQAQEYSFVTAVSSDRLTLFVQTIGYGTAMLTRSSLAAPFTNPNAPGSAPTTPGFRTRPLADCKRLIGTCTPGGCSNEDVCIYTAL